MRRRIGAVFDAGGTTVAILGTAIDNIYPRSNLSLSKRILEKGAILSEYPAGTETRRYHFTERNRIVSGLADLTIIAEATMHSGTFSTAKHALEQGKDIMAIPGDVGRPSSAGCNQIIYNGAYIFTHMQDVYDLLKIRPEDELSGLSDQALRLYAKIYFADKPVQMSTNMENSFAELELRGLIEYTDHGTWETTHILSDSAYAKIEVYNPKRKNNGK